MANGAPIPPDDPQQQPDAPPPPPQGAQPPGTIAIPGELQPVQGQQPQAPPQAPPQQPPQQPQPETPQPAPARKPSLEDMEADPDFARLSPADQQRVRQRMAPPGKTPSRAAAARPTLADMEADPDFARLTPAEQQRVRHRMSEPVPGLERAVPGRTPGLAPQFNGNLQQFRTAAHNAGYDIGVGSGYRTPERQKQLYDGAVQRYGSPEAARHWVAPPGKSMHNHGLAADLTFGSPAAREWAHQHAAEYGLNFPMGHEPWHIEPTGARAGAGQNAPPAGTPPPTGAAAPPGAPDDEGEEPEEPDQEEPTDDDLAPKSTFGNIYYRTIGRAAGAAQALEYKLGVSEETPRELAIRRHREGGAPVFPEPVPQGKFQTALTMADLLAPGIDVYAPEVAIPIYGLAALATHFSNSEMAGDITEAALSAGLLARDVYKIGGAAVRQVKRYHGIIPAAEAGYREALNVAREARTRVNELWTDHARVRQAMEGVVQQERHAAEAADAQRAAAEARATAAAEAHTAATATRIEKPPAGMPGSDVHYAMDLPDNLPDRQAVGEQLRRLDVGEMTPEGTKEGGLKAAASAMGEHTRAAYAARDARADAVGIAVSNSDGAVGVVKADIEDYFNAKLPTATTVTERKLIEELANLLGKAAIDEGGRLVFHMPMFDITDDRIPFSHLSELYSRMGSLRPARGASKGEFDAYGKVTNGLRELIISLEGADPEVARLGSVARVLHGAEMEFKAELKSARAAGKTAVAAAKEVFPFSKGADLTRAKKVMLASAAPQQEAYRLGWWRQLVETATDKASGMVDLKKLRAIWSSIPEDFRTLMAAESTPEAGAKLDQLLARHSTLTDIAHASDAEIDRLLSTKDLHATELRDAQHKTDAALKAMEKAQKDAEAMGTSAMTQVSSAREASVAAEQKAQQSLTARGSSAFMQLAQGQMGRRMGIRYAALAASSGATLLIPGVGPAAHFATMGTLAWMMLKRPMTAAESLRTVRDTMDGARLAALLAATTQGWRGTTAGMAQQQSPMDQPRATVGP